MSVTSLMMHQWRSKVGHHAWVITLKVFLLPKMFLWTSRPWFIGERNDSDLLVAKINDNHSLLGHLGWKDWNIPYILHYITLSSINEMGTFNECVFLLQISFPSACNIFREFFWLTYIPARRIVMLRFSVDVMQSDNTVVAKFSVNS